MTYSECPAHGLCTGDTCPICNLPATPIETVQAPKSKPKAAKEAKTAKALLGVHGDSYTYTKSGYTAYRILDDRIEGGKPNQVLFESSKAETRDYVLARMKEVGHE